MSESLSKRVAQFVKQQPARRAGKARAAVIALRDDIREALDDGWSVRMIWQTLRAEGSIGVGYHAFLRYVTELALQSVDAARAAAPMVRSPASRPEVARESPQSFQHERVPQKDEIYG